MGDSHTLRLRVGILPIRSGYGIDNPALWVGGRRGERLYRVDWRGVEGSKEALIRFADDPSGSSEWAGVTQW